MNIPIIKIKSRDPHETERAAATLALRLKSEAENNNCTHGYFAFIAMYGDLGAGKTAFVRGLASVLAPQAYVRSPTYTLVNEYKGEDFKIAHFDVYRIHDDDDLYSVGFYDYFPSQLPDFMREKQKALIMAVEWCENIPFALPDEYYSVRIEKSGADKPDERVITIEKINK
ncbi:MAG: tRNA (adenosine(37)-N6)-threonylcarbamoyltransferase complex ATPase subunit type 1 TsaE [Eubacteriales bacterium]